MTTHQIFPSLPSLYCCNTKQTKTNTVCTWQVKLLWMESKKNGFVYQEFHLSYFYPMPNLLLQSSRMIVWFNIYQKKKLKDLQKLPIFYKPVSQILASWKLQAKPSIKAENKWMCLASYIFQLKTVLYFEATRTL